MKKNREKLQCLQATKMIPSFIVGELSYMEHMEECESCKEELSIQFLVEVGLNSLEAGNTFDLQEELDGAMEEAAGKVRLYHFFRHGLLVLECIGIAAVLLSALLLLLSLMG